MAKNWYESKTLWIGVLTALTAFIPLLVELLLKLQADPAAIVTAVAGFALGVIQIVRRFLLNPEEPPAALK